MRGATVDNWGMLTARQSDWMACRRVPEADVNGGVKGDCTRAWMGEGLHKDENEDIAG